jgi:hypothetical protein
MNWENKQIEINAPSPGCGFAQVTGWRHVGTELVWVIHEEPWFGDVVTGGVRDVHPVGGARGFRVDLVDRRHHALKFSL